MTVVNRQILHTDFAHTPQPALPQRPGRQPRAARCLARPEPLLRRICKHASIICHVEEGRKVVNELLTRRRYQDWQVPEAALDP